ncbi:hypothetical protein V8J82_13275 [Gymnodinialimonas sp. 2305UL16-5]|uniref:hypothetical protein n=1 Tax=Gymnodinialimonas mytili TaxID=3126503 RepID=UPI003094B000
MSQDTFMTIAAGAVFAGLMGKALITVIWPENRLIRYLNDAEARAAMKDARRGRGTADGGDGWFDGDCDGGGGGD